VRIRRRGHRSMNTPMNGPSTVNGSAVVVEHGGPRLESQRGVVVAQRTVQVARGLARVAAVGVRADVRRQRTRDYVDAARALGVRPAAILGRHVLPHALGPALVATALGLVVAIVAVIFYNYLQVKVSGLDTMLRVGLGRVLEAARLGGVHGPR